MFNLLTALCLDHSLTMYSTQTLAMQVCTMQILIGIHTSNNLAAALLGTRLQERPTSPENPCAWRGVHCRGTVVVVIEWNFIMYGYRVFSHYLIKNLKWLPCTAQEVLLSEQRIQSDLDTRFLPVHLRKGEMISCGLSGSLSLITLPLKFEELYLYDNFFSGIIRLSDLPISIRIISLGANSITHIICLNDHLPKHLEELDFCEMKTSLDVCTFGDMKIDKRLNFGSTKYKIAS